MHAISVICLLAGFVVLGTLPIADSVHSDGISARSLVLGSASFYLLLGLFLAFRSGTRDRVFLATRKYSMLLVLVAAAHLLPALYYSSRAPAEMSELDLVRAYVGFAYTGSAVLAVAARFARIAPARAMTYAASILAIAAVPVGTVVGVWWIVSLRKTEFVTPDVV